MDKPCAVYRFYDLEGDLLYVGQSSNPFSRMSGHAGDLRFRAVSDVQIEWFESKRIARAAERLAIYREKPQWNKNLSSQRHPTTTFALSSTEIARAAHQTYKDELGD